MADTVNHPAHYNAGKIEVIDFIEDQQLGFHAGNVVKYVCRAGRKAVSEIEDRKKAMWYLDRLIQVKSASSAGALLGRLGNADRKAIRKNSGRS